MGHSLVTWHHSALNRYVWSCFIDFTSDTNNSHVTDAMWVQWQFQISIISYYWRVIIAFIIASVMWNRFYDACLVWVYTRANTNKTRMRMNLHSKCSSSNSLVPGVLILYTVHSQSGRNSRLEQIIAKCFKYMNNKGWRRHTQGKITHVRKYRLYIRRR